MRRILLVSLAIFLIASLSPVFASGGTGEIRISPPMPTMLSSPATFNISVSQGVSYQPQLLLVMTNSSYYGLTGNVVVTWSNGTVSFAPGDFTGDNTNGDKVPPTGATNGASYTVASLKSHLGVSNTIWWAYKPFLSGAILTTTPISFTITLPSTSPKMLVYALGKSNSTATLFDMKVPNTKPGLVVPEVATLILAASPFAAFGLYAFKRKRK